jgi:hypothetical protein
MVSATPWNTWVAGMIVVLMLYLELSLNTWENLIPKRIAQLLL